MTLTEQDYGTLTFAMENYIQTLRDEGTFVPTRFYAILQTLSDLSGKVTP